CPNTQIAVTSAAGAGSRKNVKVCKFSQIFPLAEPAFMAQKSLFSAPPRYRRNTDVKPTCDFAALKKVSDSGHK
ncbi:MAG: hypothetical protein ACPH9T_06735, partial [Paracoccaceae bacterium]